MGVMPYHLGKMTRNHLPCKEPFFTVHLQLAEFADTQPKDL